MQPVHCDAILADLHNAYQMQTSGRQDEAAVLYRRILSVDADNYNALHLLGVIELAHGSYAKALELIERAVKSVDTDPAAFNSLGEAYRGLGMLTDAEQCYRKALELDEDYPLAYNNLAVTLHQMKRDDEAEVLFGIALSLMPRYAEAYNNLGVMLVAQGRLDEAERAYRSAAKADRMYAAPWTNLGILNKNRGDIRKAMSSYRAAQRRAPESSYNRYNLSLLMLLQGRLKTGFALYENRLEKDQLISTAPPQSREWKGEHITGQSLLILTEQGAGDTIMMTRYIRMIKRKFAPVSIGICCDPPLARLLAATEGVNIVHAQPKDIRELDCYHYWCAMMSLPHLCKTQLATIPSGMHVLKIPEKLRLEWRNRLAELPGVKVGLAWAGNKALEADARRSIPLQQFRDVLDVQGCTFVSLQKDERADELVETGFQLIDFMNSCSDYLDTAALIENLDLVISVDTSVAHLAGMLGTRVWLLNRFESEWRWLLNRDDSPWYSSMKIYRQSQQGNWDGVFSKVVLDLAGLSNG